MKLVVLLVVFLVAGCAATKPIIKAPAAAPVPIAAFAIACQSIRGPIAQSIYIVLNKRLALHWTKTSLTVMELDALGNERDTELPPIDLEPILKLAQSADITDELKLGYGCDLTEIGNPL